MIPHSRIPYPLLEGIVKIRVQIVLTVIHRKLIGHTVKGILRTADPVGIRPDGSAEMRTIVEVGFQRIIPLYHIRVTTVFVRKIQTNQNRSEIRYLCFHAPFVGERIK